MRLTSIEFSFHPCRLNIYRDCPRSVPRRGQNVQKLTHVRLAIAILLVIHSYVNYVYNFISINIVVAVTIMRSCSARLYYLSVGVGKMFSDVCLFVCLSFSFSAA